jgi:hypothetical protein
MFDSIFARGLLHLYQCVVWGLRGGGGNFGVAISLEFAIHPVGPTVLAGPLIYPIDQAPRC